MIKKLILTLILILSLTGCTAPAVIDTTPQTVTVVETVVVTETVVVEDTARIEQLENRLASYDSLIASLGDMLKCVYYVYGEGNGTWVGATGFALKYYNKYWLITVGHAVDGEWGIHKNLGFKDWQGKWIYPKLMSYKVTEVLPDYAIFYSDKITNGFDYDYRESEPDYRLGLDLQIEPNDDWGVAGTCGSPVVDLDGEVVGIHVGYLQNIDEVLQEIDNLYKEN